MTVNLPCPEFEHCLHWWGGEGPCCNCGLSTCNGALHVIPVPRGMTPEESWAEIVTMGEIVEPDEHCTWATWSCGGGHPQVWA